MRGNSIAFSRYHRVNNSYIEFMSRRYQPEFFPDLAWTFGIRMRWWKKTKDFKQALIEQYDGNQKYLDLWKEVVIPYDQIILQYPVYVDEEDDFEERQLKLEANSIYGFRFGYFLMQMHQHLSPQLEDQDQRFSKA